MGASVSGVVQLGAGRLSGPGPSRLLAISLCAAITSCDRAEPARYVRADLEGRPVRWGKPNIVLHVFAPHPDSGMDQKALVAAVREAAASWLDDGCSALNVEVRLGTGRPRGGRDGVNAVVVHSKRWCPLEASSKSECYEPRLHALTRLQKAAPEAGLAEARILEADLEINAVDFRWSTAAEDRRAQGTLHLGATLVHELGHVFGLQHGCRSGGPVPSQKVLIPECGDSDLTMVPDPQQSGRTLVLEPPSSERRVLCDVYPKNQLVPWWPAWLAVLAAVLGGVSWHRRRRCCRPRRNEVEG